MFEIRLLTYLMAVLDGRFGGLGCGLVLFCAGCSSVCALGIADAGTTADDVFRSGSCVAGTFSLLLSGEWTCWLLCAWLGIVDLDCWLDIRLRRCRMMRRNLNIKR